MNQVGQEQSARGKTRSRGVVLRDIRIRVSKTRAQLKRKLKPMIQVSNQQLFLL
jgi:hypothetical protein